MMKIVISLLVQYDKCCAPGVSEKDPGGKPSWLHIQPGVEAQWTQILPEALDWGALLWLLDKSGH